MSIDSATLVDTLRAQRLLPVLREPDADVAVARVAVLAAAGCGVVELTTSTPGWDRALAGTVGLTDLTGRRLIVGMGTVSTEEQAATAVEAGAAFLVSPYPAPAVRAVADQAGIVFIEGGFAPGEIAAAAAYGPAKVFPAHVGGPAYIKSLLAVLPGAILIPTGGITIQEASDYLAAGSPAVGIGSSLPGDPEQLRRVFDVDPA